MITTFKFVNTAIVPMAASFFTISNFSDLFTAGGLLDDISIVLVYYALIHQLGYLIDPIHIIKQCRRCCMFKVTHRDG